MAIFFIQESTINLMSSNFVRSFSRFNYSQFFRINGQPGVSQTLGGVLSILIFIAMGVILVTQMIKVFQKQTLNFTTHISMMQEPPMSTISTFQHDPAHLPFMFAIDLQGGNPGKNISGIKVKACISHVQGPFSDSTRQQTYEYFNLEKCTPNHFSVISNANSKLSEWGSTNWLCLPLNTTFTIGGSFTLSNLFRAVNILLNCSGECMKTFSGLNVWLYTLSSFVNPTNSKSPSEYYFSQTTFPIEYQTQNQYSFDLDQNIIITDSSLSPFKKEEKIRSIIAGESKQSHHVRNNQDYSSTLIYFQRSGKSITYYRSYYKLMDALSFLGGTYNSIFLIFFFMSGFMTFFFQMKFASYYFKNNKFAQFSFLTYLQQILDGAISCFNCRLPNWQTIESRHQLKKTVNNLLDIIYLHKRIQFLQKAISFLFNEHQLKGIHLLHRHTKKTADQNYEQYKFRERVEYYFWVNRGEFSEQIIQEINQCDLNEDKLIRQLDKEIKQLVYEAKYKNNLISEKIYSKLDQQMKNQLQIYLKIGALEELQEQNIAIS